jgi:hypothetical protein
MKTAIVGYVAFLIASKVLDVRRRGATTEAYGAIRRKPAPAKAGGGAIEGNAADDALMADQGGCTRNPFGGIETLWNFISPEPTAR